uniref:Protein NDRG3 n=1 Tax=Syphacia muris TaxID=451379 RepID=A0A0N5AFM0_9BILA
MGSIEMEDLPLTKNDTLKQETAADIESVFGYIKTIFQEKVSTAFGNVKVSIYGNRKMHPIVTFHDIGLDSESSFQNFLQFGAIAEFSEKFCVYNINALGQEMDASPLREKYVLCPLSDNKKPNFVADFRLKSFIGLGVGAGANVMMRFALKHNEMLDALILINLVATAAGWIEWGYQKANISYLRSTGMTSFTVDYLMWHHFGKRLEAYNQDLVREYRVHFQNLPNPQNLAYFIEAYLQRTPLQFSRDGENGPLVKIPVLQIVGSGSPFVDDTVEVNARLDPANSSWMKISDSCGLVLDDKPEKVTEAMILFLQGLGYLSAINVHQLVKKMSRAHSVTSNESGEGPCFVSTIGEIS